MTEEEISNSFTSLLNKAAFSVRLISNILLLLVVVCFLSPVSFFVSVFCVCVLVALRLLSLYWKWESVPRKKERKMNRLKKKKKRKVKSSICAVWLDVFSPLLRSVFWCTSVKCGASALAHGIRLKSQYFFVILAPQSQHIKTSSRSAGLLSLSVLHTLAHTMRSDPHTAL